jgi:hypothetical protein
MRLLSHTRRWDRETRDIKRLVRKVDENIV